MSINLINYALAKKDWKKAYEDLKVLEIGGRNLIKNSAFEKGDYNGWVNIGSPPTRTVVDISDLPGFTKAFKITTNAANQGIQQTVPIVPNQEYILSWWAKDEGNLNDNHIQVFYIDLNTGYTIYRDTGMIRTLNWQRYTWNVKFNAKAITIRIGRGGGGSNYGTTYFTGLKLELGNKATDWTPAPKDINAHPFVVELAETVFRSKQNEERIRNLENAITAALGLEEESISN